jgi:signal transduction histidine kinase/CheY-like chemotaxis protein/HPt (histidine-containing phosphotransfer) domain-containing protein
MDKKSRYILSQVKSTQSENTIVDYDTFLSENRKKINHSFNVMLRALIFAGPMIALALKFRVFSGVSYKMAAFVSIFMLTTTLLHALLLKRHAQSAMTGLVALIAIDVLLCVMNKAHLSIYINWSLVPLLSLQFCDYTLYTLSVIINCAFMVFSTWDVSPWFAERRSDVATPFAYFASRIGGLSIEMTMMIIAGYILCKMISRYYKTMIEKTRELSRNHETLERLNGELSSMANIYYSAHDININDDTFFEIFLNFDTIKEIIGDEQGNARALLVKIMDKLTSPKSKEDVMRFIDFDTLNDRLRDLETITQEFEGVTGKWSKCRFIVSERDAEGNLSRVIWLVESIDAEKKQRDALINISQRALAASEAKSSFLSNMSHEIRTPINAVLGMNEMILRESEDVNILAYSESIKTAGGTLLGLVNDILDFSKIEAGKMEIIPVDYDLSSVVNDLVNMIHSRADGKGLVLALDFDKDIPKFLNGDEVRIKQVVTNILTNAVKYTEKGSIVFGINYEKVENEPDSIMLNVYVKDTGIGIKQEDMDKLFSEFERIEEDRNRNIEGTGLGMNITMKLLEMMGSSLKVESAYGLGSRFYFSIKQKVVKWEPLGDYEASYKEALLGRAKYQERFIAPTAEVLVVDDNPMNLMVFVSLLKQTKVKIDTASSGDEGIACALAKKYDIIFLDHMMPEKDGVETLHEMQAKDGNPNKDTTVVCLTANAISGAREEYIAAGFDDYLTKPIEPQRLEEMMISYLPKEKIEKTTEDVGEEIKEVLPEFLYSIKEIDTKIGITNNGSITSYIETLKVFAKNAEKYVSEIENFCIAEDIKNATIKIHALKSTARIIGASDMGELSQKLEDAGKADNRQLFDEELPNLLSRARSLGEMLSPLIKEEKNEDENKEEIGAEELNRAYEQIKEYADDCDNAGIEEVMGTLLKYKIPDEEIERIEAINEALENFDFDGITDLL